MVPKIPTKIEVVLAKPGVYYVWGFGIEAVVRFPVEGRPTVEIHGRELPRNGKRGATARLRRQFLAAVYEFRRQHKVGVHSDQWVVCSHCGGSIYPLVGTLHERQAIEWEVGHISAMAIPPEECPSCIEDAALLDAQIRARNLQWAIED